MATAIVSITLSPLLYRGVGPFERWVAKRPRLWKMLNRTATAEQIERESERIRRELFSKRVAEPA